MLLLFFCSASSMMTRRQLLHRLAAAAAIARLAPVSLMDAWAEPAKGSSIKLGAQTNAWAIDPNRFDSFLGVLDQSAKLVMPVSKPVFSICASSSHLRRRLAPA